MPGGGTSCHITVLADELSVGQLSGDELTQCQNNSSGFYLRTILLMTGAPLGSFINLATLVS